MTLRELGLSEAADPDVVRQAQEEITDPWVLVTMDLDIIEHHPGFDWSRYAIAWIDIPPGIKGQAFEAAKRNAFHHHANAIGEQGLGDLFTYGPRRHIKRPPSPRSRPY